MDANDRVQSTRAWLCESDRGAISYTDLRSWATSLGTSIHVAIMVEPYLTKVCSGEKYIESRLTKVRMSPYQTVSQGDVILFKRSGGAIEGIASVSETMYAQLAGNDVFSLVDEFGDGLSYEPGYAESKVAARFGSLFWLRHVHRIQPVPMVKRDRQAWVTISAYQGDQSTDFLF